MRLPTLPYPPPSRWPWPLSPEGRGDEDWSLSFESLSPLVLSCTIREVSRKKKPNPPHSLQGFTGTWEKFNLTVGVFPAEPTTLSYAPFHARQHRDERITRVALSVGTDSGDVYQETHVTHPPFLAVSLHGRPVPPVLDKQLF